MPVGGHETLVYPIHLEEVFQKRIQFEGRRDPADVKMEVRFSSNTTSLCFFPVRSWAHPNVPPSQQFNFPEVPSYPVFTPVPHVLYVVAVAGTTPREGDEIDDALPLFHPPDIRLRLRWHIWIKAQWLTASDDGTVTSPSRPDPDPTRCVNLRNRLVDVQARGAEWILSHENKKAGRCRT